jgi:methoxymalonate biosynthesis acyl carrier protein
MTDRVRASTRAFLARHIRPGAIEDGSDLFAEGLVNSLFAMQLVTFVEREFGVVVLDEDLEVANFLSVDAICAFVTAKQKQAAQPVAAGAATSACAS